MLESLPDYGAREIRYVASRVRVCRLDDLLFRRTPIAVGGRPTGAAVREVSRIVADALGWSEERRLREVEATLTIARDRHRVPLDGVPLGDAGPARATEPASPADAASPGPQ